MAYGFGPVSTTDNYSDPSKQETQECELIDIWVSEAPVYYQLRISNSWGPEHYLPSATGQTYFYSLDRTCSGIQFRSAVLGRPAVVVVQLIPASELPNGG